MFYTSNWKVVSSDPIMNPFRKITCSSRDQSHNSHVKLTQFWDISHYGSKPFHMQCMLLLFSCGFCTWFINFSHVAFYTGFSSCHLFQFCIFFMWIEDTTFSSVILSVIISSCRSHEVTFTWDSEHKMLKCTLSCFFPPTKPVLITCADHM